MALQDQAEQVSLKCNFDGTEACEQCPGPCPNNELLEDDEQYEGALFD